MVDFNEKGLEDKIKGTIKEVTGKITGDEKKEAEGKIQKEIGEAKKQAEEMKDEVLKDAKELKDKTKEGMDHFQDNF